MGFTIEIGQPAPGFRLPGTDGVEHALSDYADCKAVVVVFSCNHCPFVVGSEDRMMDFVREYGDKGVQLVAINSNETDNHPGDSFEKMVERAQERGFNFHYLRDETQEVAAAYGAIKTPHFFVIGQDGLVKYTGRMDDSPRDPEKVTTRDLRDAVEAVLEGREVPVAVTDSIGCNVKWRGKPEHWIPEDACDLA